MLRGPAFKEWGMFNLTVSDKRPKLNCPDERRFCVGASFLLRGELLRSPPLTQVPRPCAFVPQMRTAAPTPCQVLVPTSRQPEVLGRQTVGRKLEFPGLAFLTRMNRSIFSPSRAETHLGQRVALCILR